MKKKGMGSVSIIVMAIIAVVVIAGGYMVLSGENQKTAAYENISPKEANELINTKSPIILDVRTPDEFENGHIPQAILVPVDELKNSTFLKIPEDEEILVYCRSGHRSSWGARYLAQQGYGHAYNLSGGILAWENQGYETVEALDVENKPTCSCAVFG